MKKEHRIIIYFSIGCLLFIVIALLTLICTPLGACFAIGFEDVFTKWNIDNPYVNNNFSECKNVVISADISFCIPKSWTVKCENGVYVVLDSGGGIWAIGTLFGTDTDSFENYSDFFAATICTKPFELSTALCPEYVAMKGADVDKITITHSADSKSYYIIQLDDVPSQSFLLVLFPDISQSADDFDIAEAIMYSFAY